MDERLGIGELIERHLSDSRRGRNTQLPLADLLRQSVYSRLAGYEDVRDAERVSVDPTFPLISSQKIWERGATLTCSLPSLETESLAGEENFAGLGMQPLPSQKCRRFAGARREVCDSPSGEPEPTA